MTDPRNLQTAYAWDGLDDQVQLASPDTGVTANTFDAAGNVVSSTDARGNPTTYSYDALNRKTGAAFADGTSAAWQYDQGANGIGRLSKVTDVTGSTSYGYDANGHVTQKVQTVGAVTLTMTYGYDAGGRLASLTYPSGRQVVYAYDAAGRVSGFTEGSGTLAAGVSYQPFGMASGWTAGNGAKRAYLERTRHELKELYRAGELKRPYEQSALLPWMLAQDLSHHLAAHPQDRFVLFIDEREFDEAGAGARWKENPFDSHVRTLIKDTNGLLAVFFSRERLPWGDDPDWCDDLEGAQHLLGGLAAKDGTNSCVRLPSRPRRSGRRSSTARGRSRGRTSRFIR